ncbi:MAG: FAD:protein FMN transferase, partial [Lachnospiraceae bacterium]|nr:FAD:protein FMN transferase [Lachnospiraceae bacterium]
VLLITMTSIFSVGCKTTKETVGISFFALDTMIYIKVYDYKEKNKAIVYLEDCKTTIEDFENKMSKTKIDSDVTKINLKTIDYDDVDTHVKNVIAKSLEYREHISTLFDIYMGALIDVWDKAKANKVLPSKTEIDNALVDISEEVIPVRDVKSYIKESKCMMDLGGVAKGYIADVLKNKAKDFDVSSAIINLGGNVYVVGDKNGEDFTVGIYKPFKDNEIADTVSVKSTSVVTSGIYQRYYQVEGDDTIYHHILDKRTGYPSTSDVISASVVCENSMLSDMFATTCVVVGSKEAKDLLKKVGDYYHYDIKLILIDKDYNLIKYDYEK